MCGLIREVFATRQPWLKLLMRRRDAIQELAIAFGGMTEKPVGSGK